MSVYYARNLFISFRQFLIYLIFFRKNLKKFLLFAIAAIKCTQWSFFPRKKRIKLLYVIHQAILFRFNPFSGPIQQRKVFFFFCNNFFEFHFILKDVQQASGLIRCCLSVESVNYFFLLFYDDWRIVQISN